MTNSNNNNKMTTDSNMTMMTRRIAMEIDGDKRWRMILQPSLDDNNKIMGLWLGVWNTRVDNRDELRIGDIRKEFIDWENLWVNEDNFSFFSKYLKVTGLGAWSWSEIDSYQVSRTHSLLKERLEQRSDLLEADFHNGNNEMSEDEYDHLQRECYYNRDMIQRHNYHRYLPDLRSDDESDIPSDVDEDEEEMSEED